MRRWLIRPEGSNWGQFGDDDQLGRLNLITSSRRAAAAREARTGEAFCLSLPLDLPAPGVQVAFRHPPQLIATAPHGTPLGELFGVPGAIDTVCDDAVTLNLQWSTQWDSLAHMGAFFDADGDGTAELVYYNGFRHGEHVRPLEEHDGGAHRLGIDVQARSGVQGRGVLVDLSDAGPLVGATQLRRACDDQAVTVRPGDILCLRTGFADAVLAGAEARSLTGRYPELDGADEDLLQWVTDSGIAALAADNVAVEREDPARRTAGQPVLPLHHHCLFKLGLPLGELWHLGPLAERLRELRRTRFLLTAPPLRLPRAVGSPVTPVATL